MENQKTTLLAAINSAFRRRKYYLNSKVKEFTSVISLRKHISMTPELTEKLTIKQREYLAELEANYGYSVQMSIPDRKD